MRSGRLRAPRDNGLCPVESEDERTIVVARDHVQVAVRGSDARDVSRLTGDEEPTLLSRYWCEGALPVAAQHQAVACLHSTHVRFESIEIAGEQQVEVAVVVNVGRQNAIDRRPLGLVR